ncbi:AMP-binding protein [Streptomyces sp. DSM 42041]|uniref:AMP-binding protein n=1 Tax=Streptomyces hazeniae TaxID=3075538 RepID=A0ABU2NUX5_9ACTN|nr:AMP-binding protein [Streptomyces sp. DSM 42041]MDT0380771.1 AMP-binding protein [Streptomyces sp. DSM 42041]
MPDSAVRTAPTHRVVVDHAGRYSVHPATRARPAGWHDAGFDGTEEACLDHVARTWSGPAPTPLRRHPAYRRPGRDTLVAVLRGHARQRPDDIACTVLGLRGEETEEATYADLDRRARTVAAALLRRAAPGDRALVALPTGVDFAAAFFGCLYAGIVAVPVPLPEPSPGFRRQLDRLRLLVEDAGPAVVLTTADFAGNAEADVLGDVERLAVAGLEDALADDWRDPGATPETLAFLQYTSGSTSAPKGVVLTHHNVMENLAAVCGALRSADGFGVDNAPVQDFRFVSWLPLFHDMGLSQLLIPLFAGGRTVLMPPAAFLLRPALWLETISRYRAAVASGPDFAYGMCARKMKDEEVAALDLSSWKLALNGAEPVRWESLQAFTERFRTVGFDPSAHLPCYGMAEATVYLSGGRGAGEARVLDIDPEALELSGRVTPARDGAGRRLVSCGRVPAHHDLRIVDPQTLRERPPEHLGEIWVSGDSIGLGYWQNPEASQERFGARLAGTDRTFLRTGDLGFLSGGELFVAGRADDLIIIDGRNHFPQDLEGTAADSHPALAGGKCAAFPDPDPDVPRVVLAVETRGDRRVLPAGEQPSATGEVTADEVTRAVVRRLVEDHHVGVSAVVLLRPGGLPRTTSGKIQRKLTRKLYGAGGLKTW